MTEYDLSEIKAVRLRDVWPNEARNFTKWLAEEGNLRLLGDAVGIQIGAAKTEASVGSFSVDILARNEERKTNVVIENQLELTNHDHLGKLITYASGYDAREVIWIVSKARDEHRHAIDWLNEHTDSELNFFLVRMELWQIDDSRPAPRFEVISRPNEWAKATKQSAAADESAVTYLTFREGLQGYATEHGTSLDLPEPTGWYSVGINIGADQEQVRLNMSNSLMAKHSEFGYRGLLVWMYIGNSDSLYNFLEGRRDEIEKALGEGLAWQKYPKWPHSIWAQRPCDWTKPKDADFEWLLRTGERFSEVFPKYLEQYYKEGDG